MTSKVKKSLTLFNLIYTSSWFVFFTLMILLAFNARAQIPSQDIYGGTYFDEADAIEILRSNHPDFQGNLAIWQGATDINSTQINILGTKDQAFKVFAISRIDNKVYEPKAQQSFFRPDSHFVVTKLAFWDMPRNHHYRLVVLGKSNQLIDERFFSFLDTTKSQARIAFASCIYDLFHRPQIWENMVGIRPDMIFLIGDNVYADRVNLVTNRTADPAQLWWRYGKTFSRIALYRSKNLIPILALWDDHDYGSNNADSSFPYREEAIENFNIWWAQSEKITPTLRKGPGVSMIFTAFDQEFYFLDGRSQRTPKGYEPASFFGLQQEQWTFENLINSKKPAWLISGNQYFGAYLQKESFEAFSYENFRYFMNQVARSDRAIGFLSGDVHFSEVMALETQILGRPSVEITSSSAHSFVNPFRQHKAYNPRRIDATSWHNFQYLDLLSNGHSVSGRTTAVTVGYEVQFQYDFFLQ